ncbi:hypothetical protein CC80DRAFT_596122 [Byssothecium circinans]|uniref:Zn(2)-C6 fungal-type domain-containing protein n=1 Tax=Byssothecium circinans TaxID=147558 RepID=A0A6A5TNE5_9PLEO|nr:hypothetical protein CC80DRAFT_596122 [Byssothecium circinans]
MNAQSPATRAGEDGGNSPKRKKVRSKYAPKACVSCRRSKLKCSGENPCQRCTENGKRCFYSEDQTAAEALQNLSRPTPAQAPLSALGTNGNGLNRRNILPRHEIIERRASDASVLGLSMEARMARIEGMMETLVQERGSTITPRMSMEREEAVSDGMQSDVTMLGLGEPFFPSFVHNRHASFKNESPERARQALSGAESPATICVGTRTFPFANPTEYQRSVDFFFADLSHYYPCVNEAEFRLRSEKMLAGRSIQATDVCFLALNYLIFACAEIAQSTQSNVHSKPSGWHWFRVADKLVGKKVLGGQGDMSLIQYLILRSAYLISADEANAAHNAITLACRLCFQSGLHQQSSWRNHTPFEIHMRQRIFWTAYCFDRRISLSCGRPYCIRESDIDMEQAAYLCDRDVNPDHPLPEPDVYRSSMVFLNSMVCWGRLAADVWDGHFAATILKRGIEGENALLLDARIRQWIDDVLPTIPLLPPDASDLSPELRQLRQHTLIHTRLSQLRLLLFRQAMLSLRYDSERGRLCGDLALDIVERIQKHTAEPNHPSSFRFSMASSLASAFLVLCTLLVRDLSPLGLQENVKMYFDGFQKARKMLFDLCSHFTLAQRTLDDFKGVIPTVLAVAKQQQLGQPFPQHLVPSGIRDALPYSLVDFSLQARGGDVVVVDPELEMGGEEREPWEFEVGGVRGRYGVPWL